MVSNIEPASCPPRQTSQEFVLDVFLLHTLPKLETGTTNFRDILLTGLRFEMEKVAEKTEVGFYA